MQRKTSCGGMGGVGVKTVLALGTISVFFFFRLISRSVKAIQVKPVLRGNDSL